MEDEVILTKDGFKQLTEELETLTHQKRREVAERIKESIAFGDLSENSEYDDAKNEQAFVEARISQVTELLSRAKVIEGRKVKTSAVAIGSTVRLRDLDSGEIEEYLLAGSVEADPSNHRISNESPVGRAIIGRKVGDRVAVEVPEGTVEYEVIQIKR